MNGKKGLGLRLSWQQGIRDSDLDRTAKHVGLTLATYMSAEGFAYPSLPTLAAGCSLSKRHVQDAVIRLDQDHAGWLLVTRRAGLCNTYQATFPASATTGEPQFSTTREPQFPRGREIHDGNQGNPRHEPGNPSSPEGVKGKKKGNGAAFASPFDNCVGCGTKAALDFHELLCADCLAETTTVAAA